MKMKSDFITNSSSSSFVINLNDITPNQLQSIYDHVVYAHIFDCWQIEEEGGFVKGRTIMDNFDMAFYLEKIGIKSSVIEWRDY